MCKAAMLTVLGAAFTRKIGCNPKQINYGDE